MRTLHTPLLTLTCCALLACANADTPEAAADTPREYLYVWTGAADSSDADFLAVLDITNDSLGNGRVVQTTPVPGRANGPHHTEHEMPADGRLFANGFRSGQSFVFDVSDPLLPRIDAQFGDVEGYAHPHSFLRLPNGNVLATFQMRHDAAGMTPGGLVELTTRGEPVRSASANAPGIDQTTRVYSAAVVPALDRIVTTTTDMNGESDASRQLQLWRLSDLTLLHTFALPDGPRGNEGLYTAEPRVLRDGRTVLVSTFSCGLYLLDGLEGDAPSGRMVASFPEREDAYCAIPVIAGDYYLVTVPAWSAVVSLDISNPAAPREVSRVSFGAEDVPHWIALSPDQRRVVVTGYEGMRHRVELLTFDASTGALARDERVRDAATGTPGVRFDNKQWPHGGSAKGVPHGAVFGR